MLTVDWPDTVWDLDEGAAQHESVDLPPPVLPDLLAAPTSRKGTPPGALRPGLWTLAVAYLVAQTVARWLGQALEVYVRGTDAAGRAVARGGRAVLRWLGPVGRLLRRLAAPVVRLVRRWWDRLSVWLLVRMFRPLHRWARRLWAWCLPRLARLSQLVERLVERLAPLVRALTALIDAVEAAASRLAAQWRRLMAPVARAAAQLRRRR